MFYQPIRCFLIGRGVEVTLPPEVLQEYRRADVLARILPVLLIGAVYATFRVIHCLAFPELTDHATIYLAGWTLYTLFVWSAIWLGRSGRVSSDRADDYAFVCLLAVIIWLACEASIVNSTRLDVAYGAIVLVGWMTFSRVRYAIAVNIIAVVVLDIYRTVLEHPFDAAQVHRDHVVFTALMFILTRIRDVMQSRMWNHRWHLDATIHQLEQEVADRKAAENQVRRQKGQLRGLTRRLLTVQETERGFLSRELHDELGQVLTATKLALQSLQGRLPSNERPQIDDALEGVRESIQQIRRLSMDLRPALLDHFGIESALRWSAERLQARSSIPIAVETIDDGERFATAVETAAYRIAQEAMTNALKHANPKSVHVVCERTPESLRVCVEDDGAGFLQHQPDRGPADVEGLGLLGMRERAESEGGELTIRSMPEVGTRIEVCFSRVASMANKTRRLEGSTMYESSSPVDRRRSPDGQVRPAQAARSLS